MQKMRSNNTRVDYDHAGGTTPLKHNNSALNTALASSCLWCTMSGKASMTLIYLCSRPPLYFEPRCSLSCVAQ